LNAIIRDHIAQAKRKSGQPDLLSNQYDIKIRDEVQLFPNAVMEFKFTLMRHRTAGRGVEEVKHALVQSTEQL
jgi:DNA integrity scanning protein DisA with diadenylate cyclase activity